jgi:hypothetical protein
MQVVGGVIIGDLILSCNIEGLIVVVVVVSDK